MGPAIWKKQKGETLYALRCIPIGGYCAMEGEDGDSENPRAFSRAKAWKRAIVLVAGAAMNLLIGFLMTVIFVACYFGQHDVLPTKEIVDVHPGRPFENVLQVGDEFYEINGRRVYVSDDITMLLDREADGVHDITVIRDGKKVELKDVVMKRDLASENGPLYGFSRGSEDDSLGNVLSYSFYQSVDFGRLVWMGLGDLLSGRASMSDMGGPVMIVDQMTQAADASETWVDAMMNLLYYGAFLAINLAIMNLLPIPALDGGRVVGLLLTTAIETITRKKINPKYEGYIHAAGMILLLLLMAVILFKDVFTIVTR